MNQLVKHLVANNLEQIVSRSLLNCHCKGLHSVMLLESPGQTIRLYVAEKGNHLFKNSPDLYDDGMSLGFHPHHCNLTLVAVQGEVYNWQAEEVADDHPLDRHIGIFKKFYYQSQITAGAQQFRLVNKESRLRVANPERIYRNEGISMAAKTLHTVYASPFTQSAWLVFEGQEDSTYQPWTFSNIDLRDARPEGMYLKPTEEKVLDMLQSTGLLSAPDDIFY